MRRRSRRPHLAMKPYPVSLIRIISHLRTHTARAHTSPCVSAGRVRTTRRAQSRTPRTGTPKVSSLAPKPGPDSTARRGSPSAAHERRAIRPGAQTGDATISERAPPPRSPGVSSPPDAYAAYSENPKVRSLGRLAHRRRPRGHRTRRRVDGQLVDGTLLGTLGTRGVTVLPADPRRERARPVAGSSLPSSLMLVDPPAKPRTSRAAAAARSRPRPSSRRCRRRRREIVVVKIVKIHLPTNRIDLGRGSFAPSPHSPHSPHTTRTPPTPSPRSPCSASAPTPPRTPRAAPRRTPSPRPSGASRSCCRRGRTERVRPARAFRRGP